MPGPTRWRRNRHGQGYNRCEISSNGLMLGKAAHGRVVLPSCTRQITESRLAGNTGECRSLELLATLARRLSGATIKSAHFLQPVTSVYHPCGWYPSSVFVPAHVHQLALQFTRQILNNNVIWLSGFCWGALPKMNTSPQRRPRHERCKARPPSSLGASTMTQQRLSFLP